MRKVNEQLRELRDIVKSLKKTISESLEKIEVAINSRCKSNNNVATGESVITFKMYEPDEIKEKTKKIIRDDRVNKENALNVRKKLIEEIHDDAPDFTKMVRKVTNSLTFINVFEEVCANSATAAMERENEKHIRVNILEKLANEYRNDEEKLGKFIEDKLKLAGVLIQKNPKEITAGLENDGFRIEYALLLPRYEDTSNFRNTFIDKFRSVAGSIEVAENYKPNEIVILSMTSGFPLRYLADVERLKKEYDAKMTDINEKQHKLLLHTEGDGSIFPSLYPEKWDDDKKEEFSPYLMLAMAVGIVKYGYRGEGYGNQKVYFIDDDKKTSLNHQTYRNVVENITEEEAEAIKEMVERKLNTGEYLSKKKRDDLKQEIDGNIHKAIEKECAKNKSDWNKFVDAKTPAKEILYRDSDRLTD
jgi:hypothetical protein